jgi:nucleotide-binding universal stress UspA family protein
MLGTSPEEDTMTAPSPRPDGAVVVGVDGSDEGAAALRWAADEAASRRLPLHVVHGFLWPLTGMYLGPSPEGPEGGGLAAQAETLLADSAAQARAMCPELAVSTELVVAAPAPILVEQSRTAALVVVGHRGLGGFTGLLVGSVGIQVGAHAYCPVVVVRGDEADGVVRSTHWRRIMVGTDGSPGADAAIGFAFEEASLRGCELTVVHAWEPPPSVGIRDLHLRSADTTAIDQTGARILGEALASWEDKYPEVPVRRVVLHSAPAKALVAESARAELLVVGSRGRGGFTGLLLGSTGQAVLHHAACPVAIAHADD